jgi:hypothetical protein
VTVTNPTPQRRLRGNLPARPTERAAIDASYVASLAVRLTARDRWLIDMLYEHRVLTSAQITQLAFGVARSANMRLLELYRCRILDRFQPFVAPGTIPMHYVLDVTGAAILASEHGVGVTELRYRHDRAMAIAHNLRLAHTVAVNGFFTSLVALARHGGSDAANNSAGRALTAWWSEARCGRYFGEHVRPDGYGRWREYDGTENRELDFFLEYDFGTEALTKVAAKLADYQQLAVATGIVTPVLFWFPSLARESSARAAFAAALAAVGGRATLVPVATTASDLAPHPLHGSGAEVPNSPAGARWLPLSATASRRVRLAHLGQYLPARRRASAAPTTTTTRTTTPAPSGRSAAAPSRGTDLPAPDPMPPAAASSWGGCAAAHEAQA